ncbi:MULTISPECIES: extracellular solute-binding protein [Halolamina]|uniref:Iron(III) transport system substrate-binding protein n=1 Tax=Halolamina pelagica TaxID=699431 RepID=A0A1I5MPB9_9EURY|nr:MULTISPECIES: extracellular solute-binding protein [Halolamina]NHX36098.1 extracellular solute-binding protein [Halolamina sp. R1-12]SFP11137.1 iron(III) transport system substrate-binding protein [Halolamina pelagica]
MTEEPTSKRRRRLLASIASAGLVGVAGCGGGGTETDGPGGDGTDTPTGGNETIGDAEFSEFRGSGALAQGREEISGTRIEDLPNLEGELTIYLGGGEGGLYRDLINKLEDIYPDFEATPRASGTADAANTLISEGAATPADVFWSVDAGSLAAVAAEDLTTELPSDVTDPVPDEFHPNSEWVGTAGRARAIPYNTDALDESEIPDDVMDLPGSGIAGDMGWAPTYGAFQAFITAMRITEGEDATRQWIQGMVDAGITEYANEFFVSNAVADGELRAGFANHYYALRVQAARPSAPIDLAFTSGDAGALINVAGAAVLSASPKQELAQNFVRHLLSAEVQEYFATRAYAYPMIPGVPPVGGLPRIDELNPPEFDLAKLSNIGPTVDLMREVGVL